MGILGEMIKDDIIPRSGQDEKSEAGTVRAYEGKMHGCTCTSKEV